MIRSLPVSGASLWQRSFIASAHCRAAQKAAVKDKLLLFAGGSTPLYRRCSSPLPGGQTATWAFQPRMAPWTMGTPRLSQWVSRISLDRGLSKPSMTRSQPVSRSSAFSWVKKSAIALTVISGWMERIRAAAASAFREPSRGWVQSSCRFRLEGSKRSPSTTVRRPTPTRARYSMI